MWLAFNALEELDLNVLATFISESVINHPRMPLVMQREITNDVLHRQPKLRVEAKPTFPGYCDQSVVDIDQWLPTQKLSIISTPPPLALGSDAAAVGKWLRDRVLVLGPNVSDKMIAKCESEMVDRDCFLSMSEEDLKALFDLETPYLRDVVALRMLIVAQEDMRGPPPNIMPSFSHKSTPAVVADWLYYELRGLDMDLRLRLAIICLDELIDGNFIFTLSKEEIRNVFKLETTSEVESLHNSIRAFERLETPHHISCVSRVPVDLKLLLEAVAPPASTHAGDLAAKVPESDCVSIVVVGGTGAGKSTLLNAILGEADLLPSNCMRACTAVIIEMVFNTGASTGPAYLADVEFLRRDEWLLELDSLCSMIREARAQAEENICESEETVEEESWVTGNVAGAVMKLRSVYGAGAEDKIMEGRG